MNSIVNGKPSLEEGALSTDLPGMQLYKLHKQKYSRQVKASLCITAFGLYLVFVNKNKGVGYVITGAAILHLGYSSYKFVVIDLLQNLSKFLSHY